MPVSAPAFFVFIEIYPPLSVNDYRTTKSGNRRPYNSGHSAPDHKCSEGLIYVKTPSLGKGAAACEVAGRGYLRQYLSHKPLPAPSRWEGIAHIHRFFVF
jgi:hypothetical protein